MDKLLLGYGTIEIGILKTALVAVCHNDPNTLDLCQPKPAWDWNRAVAVVELLLPAGASVKEPFGSGITPLHNIARTPGVPAGFTRLIIDAGADVDARHWPVNARQ
ncbi:hypothetical protein BCR34DRAFT_590442 [Clohesyomyces aquaticus]|uniref:Uncharacterized protein n=1 Tax=Clohesyomyces aquaticus TaxID=1231657 RepID=A0A1Y1Z9V9_9PLEO|nr:hypothetical protein BCR34DRAFT_590442 [Clohesyomyces aquaticus]